MLYLELEFVLKKLDEPFVDVGCIERLGEGGRRHVCSYRQRPALLSISTLSLFLVLLLIISV
jgi:hypothetical protein